MRGGKVSREKRDPLRGRRVSWRIKGILQKGERFRVGGKAFVRRAKDD